MSFHAEDFLQSGARALARVFNPRSFAHMGVHLQRYYCDPAFPPDGVLPQDRDFYARVALGVTHIESFAADCRRAGVKNLWLRQVFEMKADHVYSQVSQQMIGASGLQRKLDTMQAGGMMLSVSGTQADPAPFDRPGMSGFKNTDLADRFKDMGVRAIAITGVIKDRCVSAAARQAAQNFDTFIIDDLAFEHTKFSSADRAGFFLDLAEDNIHVVTSDQVRRVMQP